MTSSIIWVPWLPDFFLDPSKILYIFILVKVSSEMSTSKIKIRYRLVFESGHAFLHLLANVFVSGSNEGSCDRPSSSSQLHHFFGFGHRRFRSELLRFAAVTLRRRSTVLRLGSELAEGSLFVGFVVGYQWHHRMLHIFYHDCRSVEQVTKSPKRSFLKASKLRFNIFSDTIT